RQVAPIGTECCTVQHAPFVRFQGHGFETSGQVPDAYVAPRVALGDGGQLPAVGTEDHRRRPRELLLAARNEARDRPPHPTLSPNAAGGEGRLDELASLDLVERRPQYQQLVECQPERVHVAAGSLRPSNASGGM